VFYFYCMSLSLRMRQFNVSDNLKACFEMVLFAGISGKTVVSGDESSQLWLES
jgi:hypothetical protein